MTEDTAPASSICASVTRTVEDARDLSVVLASAVDASSVVGAVIEGLSDDVGVGDCVADGAGGEVGITISSTETSTPNVMPIA